MLKQRLSAILLTFSFLLAACSGGEAEEPIVVDTSGTETTGNGETGSAETAVDEPAPDPASQQGQLVVGEDTCETDADCVPAACCHPAACVAQANAPSCAAVMCTSDCRYGTLDCGGSCLCHEGRCAARLSVAPQMGTVEGSGGETSPAQGE